MAVDYSDSSDKKSNPSQEIDGHFIITTIFNPIFNSFICKYIHVKPVETVRTGGLMEIKSHDVSPLYRIATYLDYWRINLTRKCRRNKISFLEFENEIRRLMEDIYGYALTLSNYCKLSKQEMIDLNELLKEKIPEFLQLIDKQLNTNFSDKTQIFLQKVIETYRKNMKEEEVKSMKEEFYEGKNYHRKFQGLIESKRAPIVESKPEERKREESLTRPSLLLPDVRPSGVSLLATFSLFYGVLLLLSSLFIVAEPSTAATFTILGLIHLITAWGLRSRKKWAWWATIIIIPLWSILISSLPFGVIIGLLILLVFYYYLFKPDIRNYFGVKIKFIIQEE